MSPNDDTEITLGTGKMLAMFFGLVILCAVFFGMGFSMGKNSVKSGPDLLDSKSVTTPQAPPEANSPSQSGSSPEQPPQTPPPAGAAYFVQVAAVSKQEDAEALVESLKGRQYAAFIASPSPDKFFHVQVGPFSDIKEAESMRAKLVSDGYNPILKK